MRRLLISLVILLVAASAATGVHASTDCERWFIAYKSSLEQTKTVKKLRVAKHRMQGYVHRKLATYRKPRPVNKTRVLAAHARRPKMTREEMIRHFNLACGELPDSLPQVLLADNVAPGFSSGRPLYGDEAPGDGSDGLVPSNVLPPSSPGNSGWSLPPYGGIPPVFGGGGGGGGGGSNPGGPGGPGGPGNPPGGGDNPPPPVIPPVPEPSSIVLLLTGIAGAAGMVRRRIQRQS